MKAKDIRYLAKCSLQAEKKKNAVMVAFMAISMIFFVPIVVLWVGVNMAVSGQIHSMPYLLYLQGEMKDYRIQTEDSDTLLSGWLHMDELSDINGKTVYESYELSRSYLPSFTTIILDGESYKLDDVDRTYNILDTDKSDADFPQTLQPFGHLFTSQQASGFRDGGKGQVIVSELLLDAIGLTAADVQDKPITVRMDDPVQKGYLCYEYTVVGVIRREVSQLFLDTKSYMSAMMFFTDKSVYDENGEGMLKPILQRTPTGDQLVYRNADRMQELNREYMMLGLATVGGGEDVFAATRIEICDTDFASLAQKESLLRKRELDFQPSALYGGYSKLYSVGNMISFVVGIVGIVLLLVTGMYNYLNIKHNVNRRKYFLTVLRAIGARNRDIPRIYMAQTNMLCLRAAAIFEVFGTAISVAIKWIVDFLLRSGGGSLQMTISWGSIVLSLVCAVALLFAIANLIALVCVSRMSRQPIVSVLKSQE